MKDDPRLEGLTPPTPPPELRARVLAGACRKLAEERPHAPFTRFWESRSLRIAWGLSMAVLVVAHAAITPRPLRMLTRKRPAIPAAQAGDRELAALFRLPRIDENARLLTGAAQRRRSS